MDPTPPAAAPPAVPEEERRLLPTLNPNTQAPWRAKLYGVIFGHTTRAGRAFDLALIVAIGLSVLAVIMESVEAVRTEHGEALRAAEWGFTVLFTVEYVLRLLCVAQPRRYALSFFGLIDLLALLPTYLSIFFPGAQALLVIRTLRFVRVFRILKLVQYLSEADLLGRALWSSRRKIFVFIFVVLTLDVIFGALMYVVEGAENGFDSIPRSIYWAVVTLTTVGYGDISPQTNLGQAIATFIMILGYGIIAVPTGIVTAEIANASRVPGPGGMVARPACLVCGLAEHTPDARYCRRCGERLAAAAPPPEHVADEARGSPV